MASDFLSKIVLSFNLELIFLIFTNPSYLNYNNFCVIIPVERFSQVPFRFAAFKISIYLQILDRLKLLALGWSIC